MDEIATAMHSLQTSAGSTSIEFQKDEAIQITLCRSEKDKLVKQITDPRTIKYHAISHVWGRARWQHVDIVAGDVLVSDEKAKFIREQLRTVIGEQWFWMDILCVNQLDPDARVSVTQHIPLIFRLAEETIVIKGTSGIRDCCIQATGSVQFKFFGKSNFAGSEDDAKQDLNRDNEPDGRIKLMYHLYKEHRGEMIEEGVLTRLWPLQEINLSDIIQFVQSDKVEFDAEPPPSIPHTSTAASALVQSLSTLATNWSTYGTGGDDYTWHRTGFGKTDFVEAFFTNGTAFRGNSPSREAPDPRPQDILMHINSTRHTSKTRDFILAIFPQFGFYKVPASARRMTFAELFWDCCRQVSELDKRIAPLLNQSPQTLDGHIGETVVGIPEPTCLGDMVKLFNGPVLRSPKSTGHFMDLVTPYPISKVMDAPPPGHGDVDPAEITDELRQLGHFVNTVHITARNIFNSTVLWIDHEITRLSTFHNSEYADQIQSLKGLSQVLKGIDYSQTSYQNSSQLTENISIQNLLFPLPWRVPILYACMISCGLGISAYEWARERLEPIIVTINRVSHTLLAPKELVGASGTMYLLKDAEDFLIGRDGPMPRLGLLAFDPAEESGTENDEHRANAFNGCLFPPDSKFKGSRQY